MSFPLIIVVRPLSCLYLYLWKVLLRDLWLLPCNFINIFFFVFCVIFLFFFFINFVSFSEANPSTPPTYLVYHLFWPTLSTILYLFRRKSVHLKVSPFAKWCQTRRGATNHLKRVTYRHCIVESLYICPVRCSVACALKLYPQISILAHHSISENGATLKGKIGSRANSFRLNSWPRFRKVAQQLRRFASPESVSIPLKTQ